MIKKIFASCLVIGMFSAASVRALGPVGSFNKDGNQIFTAHSNVGNLWDLSGNQTQLKGHKRNISGADFSPNGTLVATGSDDKTVKVWNTSDGSLLTTLTASRSISSITFSPDGTLLTVGTTDGKVNIWQTSDWSLITTLTVDTKKAVMDLEFDPTGTYLATSAFADENAKLWTVSTWTLHSTLQHAGGVVMVRFNTNGSQLITASKDATAKTWTIPGAAGTPSPVCDFVHGSPVPSRLTSAIYTPLGTIAFTAGKDSDIKIWNTSSCTQVTTLTGHTNIVDKLDVDPDSNFLVSGSWDNTAKVWNLTTHTLDKTLTGHTNAVSVVQYNNGGSLILTVAWDGSARVWNATTGNCELTLIS